MNVCMEDAKILPQPLPSFFYKKGHSSCTANLVYHIAKNVRNPYFLQPPTFQACCAVVLSSILGLINNFLQQGKRCIKRQASGKQGVT